MIPCEICQNPIMGKYAKRFCSPSCRARWINAKRWKTKPPRHCELCGEEIKNRSAKRFCSILCRNKNNVKYKHKKAKRCKCGAALRPKYSICHKCLLELPMSVRSKQYNILVWREDEIDYLRKHYPTEGAERLAQHFGIPRDKVLARVASLKITLLPETRKRIAVENSRERMINNNPMHDDDSKQKMLDWWNDNPEAQENRTTKHLKWLQKRDRRNPSSLEKRLHNILDDFGVEYQISFIIKPKFVVDIRIGDLIIQADGDYWHGHPRFEPLTDRQVNQQKKDKAQDRYLNTCGYKVERVWESDMDENHIKSILKKHGII